MTETLIEALQVPGIYPHPVSQFEVIETHLSWVILTGLYAYKIKKPLNLGFQDFSSLEKRRHFCELEVTLNKQFAPEIYIDVIPITGSQRQPQFQGEGLPIEYAIKMHQFQQENLLSALAKKGKITNHIVENIAYQIAHYHQKAQSDLQTPFGEPHEVLVPILDNFQVLKQHLQSNETLNHIETIEKWSMKQYQRYAALLTQRKKQGFIRVCHGDLHLGNIVMIKDRPLIFDCIEFNESFRWTDVFNDVGFLAMDLEHYHLSRLSHLFVNKYLEFTGDYSGVPLLTFYQSYRAMVRAKITAIQLKQLPSHSPLITNLQQTLKNFLTLALSYTEPKRPTLTITFGLSGSGKTLYTEHLLMKTGALRLRSDVIRKQQFGFDINANTNLPKKLLYTKEATIALYSHLQEIAENLLSNGLSVIIDATCLQQWQRQLFIDLAQKLNVEFQILSFEAPEEKLKERIRKRLAKGIDASDADETVLSSQLSIIEPLSKKEKSFSLIISADGIDYLINSIAD